MNKVRSFQEILSIGYLYLIAIGVLSETFYYKQIGIDILSYSTILDVLISPLVQITSSFGSVIGIGMLIFFIFRLPSFLVKRRHTKWVQKSVKIEESASDEEAKNNLLRAFMLFFALLLFGFFIGTGIGSGLRLTKKIENGELSYGDQIEFISNEKINVEIVGINSAYVFYMEKGASNVKITPISGIVKTIEND